MANTAAIAADSREPKRGQEAAQRAEQAQAEQGDGADEDGHDGAGQRTDRDVEHAEAGSERERLRPHGHDHRGGGDAERGTPPRDPVGAERPPGVRDPIPEPSPPPAAGSADPATATPFP